MNRIKVAIMFCSLILVLCISKVGAQPNITGGAGMGSLMFKNDGTETALGIPGYISLAWPIAHESSILLDFEMTFSGKANLVGISLFVGGGLQQRVGPVHLGFGPGLIAGGWLLTPDDNCEEDYSCIGGVAGISGFALSGEVGYAIARPDGHRLDLIVRGVATPKAVSHDVQLIQIYLGIRISQ